MTSQRAVSVRPAVFVITALAAAVAWLVASFINQALTAVESGPVLAGVKPLIPATGPFSTASWPAPWPVLIPLAGALMLGSLLLAALPAVLRPAPRSNGLTVFLLVWACVVAAAAVVGGLLVLGGIVADWPPARWAFLFRDVQPQVGSGAYWGLVWGWIPAVVGILTGRRPAESATAPSPRRIPAGRGTTAILRLGPVLGFAVVLVAAISLASTAHRDAAPAQTPVASEPAPAPVPIGHPDVSYAVEEGAPGSAHPDGGHWCSGDEVRTVFGVGDAATGHRFQELRVTNTSSRACRLGDYPDIAFDDAGGNAMNVLFYRGGSFMTEDQGTAGLVLDPGQSATAAMGWNAMAASGDTTPGTALVAPYAGTLRTRLPVGSNEPTEPPDSGPDIGRYPGEPESEVTDRSPVLDIVDGGAVAITGWAADDADGS